MSPQLTDKAARVKDCLQPAVVLNPANRVVAALPAPEKIARLIYRTFLPQLLQPDREALLGLRVEYHRSSLKFFLHVVALDIDPVDYGPGLGDVSYAEAEKLGNAKPGFCAEEEYGPVTGGVPAAEARRDSVLFLLS